MRKSVRSVIFDMDCKTDLDKRKIILKTDIELTIIYPVYNENLAIKNNLVDIDQIINSILGHTNYEIIIAENGVVKKTLFLEKFIIDNNLSERVYGLLVEKKGRGGAINKALGIAKGKFVAIMAIDRAWDEIFLGEALHTLKNNPSVAVVFGSKTHLRSRIKRPMLRKIASFIIRLILIFLFRRILGDTQNIKMFRKESVGFLKNLSNDYNYFAETEFYLRTVQEGLHFVELPVNVRDYRKESKVNMASLFEFIKEALNFKKRNKK